MLGAHKHSLVGLRLSLLCEAEPGRAQIGVWPSSPAALGPTGTTEHSRHIDTTSFQQPWPSLL